MCCSTHKIYVEVVAAAIGKGLVLFMGLARAWCCSTPVQTGNPYRQDCSRWHMDACMELTLHVISVHA